MPKMLTFFKVKEDPVLETWKHIASASLYQKVYFHHVFSFFVNVVLCLRVYWPDQGGDPSYEALILFFKESNIGIGLVVNLHC